MKIARFFCLFIFLLGAAAGRSQVLQGSGEPSISLRGNWYLDTLNHQAYNLKSRGWSHSYDKQVFKMTDCSGMVTLETDHQIRSVSYSGRSIGVWTGYDCGDGLNRMVYNSLNFFYRDTTFLGRNWNFTGTEATRTQYLRGDTVYCATAFPSIIGWAINQNIRAWGLLDRHGNWIVEPKFDEPFFFKGGIADVVYYGEKRKINEKGEFVK